MNVERRSMACVAVTAALTVGGQQADLPPEWFQAPQTASELGITTFSAESLPGRS